MEPITSVHGLVRELLRLRDPAGYGDVLARYSVPTRDLAAYFRWNDDHYTRNCIMRNDDLELLVICYGPGRSTSIHDYNSTIAWVHPVIGEVVEERFGLRPDGSLRLTQETHLRPGMLGSLTRENSIHRFSNRTKERAVTLNLYAPPMSQWRVYDGSSGSSEMETAGPHHAS